MRWPWQRDTPDEDRRRDPLMRQLVDVTERLEDVADRIEQATRDNTTRQEPDGDR